MEQGIVFNQPGFADERRSVAARCCAALKLSMPCVVDTSGNDVDNLYAGWPERLFIVGADGRIAYAGRQGPWGFKPVEVGRWLRKHVGPPAPRPSLGR